MRLSSSAILTWFLGFCSGWGMHLRELAILKRFFSFLFDGCFIDPFFLTAFPDSIDDLLKDGFEFYSAWLVLSKLESLSSSSSLRIWRVSGLSWITPYPPTLFFLVSSSIILFWALIFNSAFSSKHKSSSTVYYLFILGEFLTALALWPNLKDVTVSASLYKDGDILTIRLVKEFPPKLSWSNRVNFESLYGIWFFPSLRAWITLPKADKLVLILIASFNCLP